MYISHIKRRRRQKAPAERIVVQLFIFSFWIGLCGLVGCWSHHKGSSGATAFFASMVLTPIIVGIMVAFISKKPIAASTERG